MSSYHFSSGIVEWVKREDAWKSPHGRKARRGGERKMRDYRQSPSFWPFTSDWFWSVKFVSPSKSIKCIQWDSFSHWAVIALVISKLEGIFLIFFAAVLREELDSVKRGVGRQHTTFTSCQNAACSNIFFLFLWRVDYALEENVLTDQMWFLPLISDWEVVTRILIFCGHCFWSAWFALWCNSMLSLTSFEI